MFEIAFFTAKALIAVGIFEAAVVPAAHYTNEKVIQPTVAYTSEKVSEGVVYVKEKLN